ncbi:uncharacterized protein LOC126782541 isoform X2 [Argentina anserina]|uniref:uncharacterized protein LOC126782541 isoform X2 n=1 Tax=Argentina anserina TaxID=57926 RepID=UPI00217684ED|nr:uncharacterized protein LOC126782541 isoform X2 [Potentilla anserina]
MEGGEIGELQDWEVLHSAGEEEEERAAVVESHGSFSAIEADAEGMIRSDYFSLENQGRFVYAKSEESSVESDNPSWIDPVSVTSYKEPGGFWSDSASDRSDDRKSHDFEVRNELGFAGNEESLVLSESVGDNLGKAKVGYQEIGKVGSFDKDMDKFWSDSGGESSVSVKFDKEGGSSDSNKDSGEEEAAETQSVAVEEVKAVAKSGGEGEKRMVLWWKVPLEVLKYCVFKVSPVWSFSVAAAVMGLVILGRRLYRMKRRRQSLQLKVALDDKVSQFMTRAVRLNEAFSVVRRVPMLRPSLPAAGVNPWPVMSLR